MSTRKAGVSTPDPQSPSHGGASALDWGLRDPVDRALVTLLQANARESTASLARKLGVARTTVVAKLARLETDGLIAGYTVRLGGEAVARGVQAYVGITVQPRAGRDVVRRLAQLPELRQLASVSGEYDYMALIHAENTARLDALLDDIGEIEGVIKTHSSVLLALRVDRSG
ncbi:Lrp/AsnC family transcriptional regulator [Roseateles sp. BYS180W]|uniref:Lrp/AsnC family transcriptional regulator n=1 Tax=Roseateles rivi TaxID=3299028 RepID=A0ABW7FUP2_9BURK